ncbi:MAG: peptide chain release factor-like protein [Actinobacteria bacterium]|nr:MAG: peptide chain release factor-like protein [Actinomycetota bacterium]
MEDPMPVARGVAIPLREVELRASRSSGPGGQHANVTASRVMARCGPRVTAIAQDARSQARNRELALERLRSRLSAALAVPRRRRATRPSRASRELRLERKRRRGQLKRSRRSGWD